MTLALLLTAVGGAWAQTETLLTTITATAKEQASYSTANVATVSFSYTANGSSAYLANWGWWGYGWSATVTAAEGYTITKCIFYDDANRTATDSEAPFVVETTEEDKTPRINGTPIDGGNMWSKGIKKIEVYGYATPVATGYSVTLPEGTEDAENWTISDGTNSAKGNVGLSGLNGGETVTITYNGTKRVKSVTATKVSFTGVKTFSELQTALSAGKDVKLMNDIECTAEIEITSGALTIDGNGKKLSTTSAIRAFTVKSPATVAFKNLTLTGFVSGGGPAINNNGGTIVLDGCTISNCHVSNTQGGGAIENKGTGKLYAINTTFSGNHSGEIGGAINNFNGSLYMSDCTFTDNYTTSSNAFYGGAIGINGGSEIRLINCAFSGNKYGTTAGTNDIGVYNKPTNYTIAGYTEPTIASNDGVITTNTTGTATLDYSDLSNIKFTVELGTAEGHALSASTVGMIVGSDGKAYPMGDKDFLPTGVKAEAVVTYKSGSNGFALAIVDYPNKGNHDAASGTYLTQWRSAHPVSGCTWVLPTREQWKNTYNGFGGTAPTAIHPATGYQGDMGNLNTYLTGAGGTAMTGNHWTNTENGTNAWVCTNSSSAANWCNFNSNEKNENLFVRYGIAF